MVTTQRVREDAIATAAIYGMQRNVQPASAIDLYLSRGHAHFAASAVVAAEPRLVHAPTSGSDTALVEVPDPSAGRFHDLLIIGRRAVGLSYGGGAQDDQHQGEEAIAHCTSPLGPKELQYIRDEDGDSAPPNG